VTSSRGRSGAVDSGSRRSALVKATTPIGTLTKKMARHGSVNRSAWISKPPVTGPRMVPSPSVAPKALKALPRSAGGKRTWITESTCGNIRPLAIPCTTRLATSIPGLTATPHSADDPVNRNMPRRNRRLRP